jgi:hypothetical protein
VGASAQQFGLSEAARGAAAVLDVRPHVEVEQQLAALHGSATRGYA